MVFKKRKSVSRLSGNRLSSLWTQKSRGFSWGIGDPLRGMLLICLSSLELLVERIVFEMGLILSMEMGRTCSEWTQVLAIILKVQRERDDYARRQGSLN